MGVGENDLNYGFGLLLWGTVSKRLRRHLWTYKARPGYAAGLYKIVDYILGKSMYEWKHGLGTEDGSEHTTSLTDCFMFNSCLCQVCVDGLELFF